MSLLSPRLQLKVAQKQILTPGLVQMVTVLQLNRLELKEMITQEIVKNPVLEEATEEPGEEITPEELLALDGEILVPAAWRTPSTRTTPQPSGRKSSPKRPTDLSLRKALRFWKARVYSSFQTFYATQEA